MAVADDARNLPCLAVLFPDHDEGKFAAVVRALFPCGKSGGCEAGGPRGTFSAYGLAAMRRQPPTLYRDPEEVVTLEVELPPDDVSGPDRRVLLLEDRDDFREVLRDHLVFRRFQVISVPSGVEGLREITKGAFDLII